MVTWLNYTCFCALKLQTIETKKKKNALEGQKAAKWSVGVTLNQQCETSPDQNNGSCVHRWATSAADWNVHRLGCFFLKLYSRCVYPRSPTSSINVLDSLRRPHELQRELDDSLNIVGNIWYNARTLQQNVSRRFRWFYNFKSASIVIFFFYRTVEFVYSVVCCLSLDLQEGPLVRGSQLVPEGLADPETNTWFLVNNKFSPTEKDSDVTKPKCASLTAWWHVPSLPEVLVGRHSLSCPDETKG